MPDGDEVVTSPLQAVSGASADGWVLGGRYRIQERVGSGGMAEVFRAHDELLDRDVAVKVFRTLMDDPDSSENAASRRELELQAMARLNHPNLVTLFDGSVGGDGPPYLVLEYVPGPDLATRLRGGPLPEPEVRELGAQLADGLAYVHAHGLVHRDVKPANILLGSEDGTGRARLSDFGVVRMIGRPQMTSAELTIGTAYYLAPEQARGSNVGPEADVYALGLVLLEALTGVRPFDGPLHEALAARLTAEAPIPDGLPEPWPGLLAAMTARDPADRPDAAGVARQLGAGTGTGTGPLAAAPPVPAVLAPADAVTAAALAAPVAAAIADPPRRPHKRRTPVLLAAAAAVAGAAALGAYLLPASSEGNDPSGTTPTTGTTAPSTPSARHHKSSVPAVNVVDQPSSQEKAHKSRARRTAAATVTSTAPTRTSSSAVVSPSASPSSSPSGSSAPPSSAPTTGGTGSSTAAAAVAPSPSSSPPGP